MKTYNLFISHSWKYSNSFDNLRNLLRNRPYFNYRDYSVPEYNPILGARTDKELRAVIKNKIDASSVVIIVAGVYATYSKWINIEIDIAKNDYYIPKPILAIKPFGGQNISSVVRENADAIVNWNVDSIVEKIRSLA